MSLKLYSHTMLLGIKPTAKKQVLLVLADYVSDLGKSSPRIETIKKYTDLTEEKIAFYLGELVSDKLIVDTGERIGDMKDVRVFQIIPVRELPKLTAKKKPSNPEFAQAEEIYRIYPRPVAKPRSLAVISKAIAKHGFDFVKERTVIFAGVWKGRTDVNSLCPHSSTWYHQERFADDPVTWGASPNAAKPQLVKLADVNEYIAQHFGKDIYGWGVSFHRTWQSRGWKRKGSEVIIDWKIELSKQLAIWRTSKGV